jgi:tetratricopeptide (TPR) repeat protein
VVGDLQLNDPAAAALLTHAVYLRRGVSRDLLLYIAETEQTVADPNELQALIDEFTALPFVKVVERGWHNDQTDPTNHSETLFVLHDEIYDLLFDKVAEKEVAHWYRSTIAFLEEKLTVIDREMLQATDPRQLHRRQTVQIDLIFYRMALNPGYGYQDYRELVRSAIEARDIDFDTQLQDELARFFDNRTKPGLYYRMLLERTGMSWNKLLFDESVSWIMRRLYTQIQSRDRYRDAVEFAQQITDQFASIYQINRLARCELDSARLRAETFIAESIQDSSIPDRYLVLIRELKKEHAAASDETQWKRIAQILAETYANRGYYARLQQRFQDAIDDYEQAIRLYRKLGAESNGARVATLSDLSFALFSQGEREQSLEYIQRTLALAELVGSPYQIATVLVTQARIIRFSDPRTALRSAKKAMKILEALGSKRALALCHDSMGLALHRIALQQSDEAGESDQRFVEAIEHYQKAIYLFDTYLHRELTRRIEVRLNLGNVHRDWALTIRRKGGADPTSDQQFDIALNIYGEAHRLCTETTPAVTIASILEDMAVVHVTREMFVEARQVLAAAREQIPERYGIIDDVGINLTPENRRVRIYWLRLAQIELQTALCDFGQKDPRAGCITLLKAFAFLRAFAPASATLSIFRRLVHKELMRIGDIERLQMLRHDMTWEARKFRIPRGAVAELEALFNSAIKQIEFF